MTKKESDLCFWYLIDYFNLYKLGIYAPYNGFKEEFPVSNIFNWLKENNIFYIEMTKVISCQLCGYNNTNTIYLSPLISISKDHLIYKSLNDIILILKEPSSIYVKFAVMKMKK